MIVIGKSYLFKHCMNDNSEWNGKVVTIEPGGYGLLDKHIYVAVREGRLRGDVLEEELIEP